MKPSVESNSLEKIKAIASLHILPPYFRFFIFLKKKDFSENTVNLGMEIFNFDDIRTNFLQVLTYFGFLRSLCYDDARH